MQRRLYLLTCIAVLIAAVFLGEKAWFGHVFDRKMQETLSDIETTETRIANEQAAITKKADAHVKNAEKQENDAIADAKRKAEERQREYDAEKMRLDRELAIRGETVKSFAFASDSGHSEIADDLRTLEDGLSRLRAESARIKRLHEAFGRRQFLSKSIREADSAVETVEEALAYAEGRLRDAAALSVHADAAAKGSAR